MNIRAAVETDVPALIAILRRSWLTTWAPELRFETVQKFAREDPARRYAEEKWREFAVIEDGGIVAGMFHLEGDTLNAIHLEPKRKREKIGTLLMDEIERRIASSIARHDTRCWRLTSARSSFIGVADGAKIGAIKAPNAASRSRRSRW